MRSVIYENQLYPNYSKKAIVAKDVAGWRSFLESIGAGHNLDSIDLRAIPGSELINKLKPMLYDPDLVFTLEFTHGQIAKEILDEAKRFEEAAPRQSSSYLVSRSRLGLSFISTTDKFKTRQDKTNRTQAINAVYTQLDLTYNYWYTDLKWLRAGTLAPKNEYDYVWVESTDKSIRELWPGTKVKAAVEHARKTADEHKDSLPKNEVPELATWEDAGGNTKDILENKLRDAYIRCTDQAIRSSERLALADKTYPALFSNPEYVLEDCYSMDEFTQAVTALANFLISYCKAVEHYLETTSDASYTSVVVRFYPQNATISEPIPTVTTVPLSENSFVQVASPQQNIMISFIGNMTLDTPDTQWRELYARILKIILKHGNPPCKARVGRYMIDKCYLFQVSDLSQTTNSAPVFNVTLISENYDTKVLQSVDYVG